ncbi:putative undecaprenyl diphosphate synthase-domain-containing protein [Powellomyces hirtus]|nr:putative undecaprenyl diphosphate synthase-domain-containing protein [Powellomyces hirtus]
MSCTNEPSSARQKVDEVPPSLFSRAKNFVQDSLIRLLRSGPVPKHVAFIMDGNRRYAKKVGVKAGVGHVMGSSKLEETLEWCLNLGVRVVTVYAFSIENFKRPQEEVDVLMDLACKKFEEFSENSEIVEKYSIRVRVLGDLSLLPPHVREAAMRAETSTRHNHRAVLNICCPYTARHEMAHSIGLAVQGVREGHIQQSDIDEPLLNNLMGTGEDSDLDVLVRTSGEKRLSDFLLWQVSGSCQVHFLDVLWPEFTFWNMLPILLSYQANYPQLHADRTRLSMKSWDERGAPVSVTSDLDQRAMVRQDRVNSYIELLRKHM